MRKAPLFVALAATAWMFAACDAPPNQNGNDGGPGGGSCTAMTVGSFSADAHAGWAVAPVVDPTGSLGAAFVRVELNQFGVFKHFAGDFDLSKETNYAIENHAVVVLTGDSDPRKASPKFIQLSGSMHLDQVDSPPGREFKGNFSSVKLMESTLDPVTNDSSPVPNGRCVTIASGSFDTTVPLGTKCVVADDCGDTRSKVCDPATSACVKSQCDGTPGSCPAGDLCVVQSLDSLAGACYAQCTPFGSPGCSGDSECIVFKLDQSIGTCRSRGPAAEGATCTINDVGTGCVAGTNCVVEESGPVCRKQCDYWSATPICPSGQHCAPGSKCTTNPYDPAAIDAPCDGTSVEATPCGRDGSGTPRGLCVEEGTPAAPVCRKPCRKSTASDCPTGKSCADWSETVGVCR